MLSIRESLPAPFWHGIKLQLVVLLDSSTLLLRATLGCIPKATLFGYVSIFILQTVEFVIFQVRHSSYPVILHYLL